MNWVSIVGFAAVGQCVLLAARYIIGRNSRQQQLLIALFLTLAIYLLHEVLVQSQLMVHYTWLYGWGPLFPLLLSPLLYLYVKSILNERYRIRPFGLLHFLPFCLAVISRVDLIFSSAEYKTERLLRVFQGQTFAQGAAIDSYGLSDLLHFVTWHLQPMVYFALIVMIIIRSKERIYSLHKITRWLKILSFGLLIYFMADYMAEILSPRYLGIDMLLMEIPVFSFYTFCLCLLVIYESPSYVVSPISDDIMFKGEIEQHFEKLQRLVMDKRIYLRPSLQLAELGAELGLQGRDISLVIKKSTGLTYNDYINSLRIQHSKELMNMAKYQSYTVTSIGEESGFTSKDAFYRAFKKFSGTTPRMYLDQITGLKS